MKRILIQDQQTKHFLNKQGEWTQEADDARNFPTTLNAMVYGLQQNLTGIQLLVRFDDSSAREFIFKMDEAAMGSARQFATQPHLER